jgi:hypothetical protein
MTLRQDDENTKNFEQPSDRRRFLKSVSVGVGMAAVAGTGLFAGGAALGQAKPGDTKAAAPAPKAPAAGGALELVKEDDPLPKGLGYVHDATKAVRADKAGTKGADQLCSNCQFYVKSGELNKEEVGKCQLFPKGVVKAKGWCKSWIKKPG